MNINKNLLKKLVLTTSFVVGHFASANMLLPFATDFATLGFNSSQNNSMFLGQWKNQIANKLNPSFYSNLDKVKSSTNFSKLLVSSKYVLTQQRFIVPVFADNFSLDDFNKSGLYFSFSSEQQLLHPFAMKQLINDVFSPVSNTSILDKRTKAYSKLIGQELYTPGYVLTNGKSSFGVGAILVQQRFLDDSFGNITFSSTSTFQPYNDKTFINTSKGAGYQLNFTQQLPANISFNVDYRSRIKMNEFDTLGSSYSESGDFDIPRQYTLSLSVPFSHGYKLNLSSENIDYSNSKAVVHAGYSEAFLRIALSPLRPLFELEDLTVYALGIEKQFAKNMSWKATIITRQQAPATKQIFDTILKNDTAAYSYRLGFSKNVSMGKFDFYASYADKPLLIGGTEFGRLTSTELTRHIEGVASWSFSF